MSIDDTDADTLHGDLIPPGGNALTAVATAEIHQGVATARLYPRRSPTDIMRAIEGLACVDQDMAEECMYSVPRGGKPIEGPSVRFAEIVMQQVGNNRVAARLVEVNRAEGFVVVEAAYHDLQTNSLSVVPVRRKIERRRGTNLITEDAINLTAQAAVAIATRNAILKGTSQSYWRRPFEVVRKTIMGDVTTLTQRREEAIKSFQRFGITADQVFAALGVKGEDDIGIEHIVTLRGSFRGLLSGELTSEEFLSRPVGGNGPAEQQTRPAVNPLKEGEPEATPTRDAPAPAKSKEIEPTKPDEEKKPEPAKPEPEKQAVSQKPAATEVQAEQADATEDDGRWPEGRAPRNVAEYRAYAEDWIDHEITGKTKADERWKKERKLRNECGLTGDDVEGIKDRFDAKVKALG